MSRKLLIPVILTVWIGVFPMRLVGQGPTHPGPSEPERPSPSVPDASEPLSQIEAEAQRHDRDAARKRREQERARRVGHQEALRQLQQDLPQLHKLLEQLKAGVREADAQTQLNVRLREQAKEFEKLAKRTKKNIGKL